MEKMGEKKEKMASTFTLQNFSSTAKLADNEKEYNPFEHRDIEHPNSDMGSLVHLLKSSLGSGILAMPMAFKNGGLLVGAIGTFLVGFICTHCVHILVKCSHELCGRSKVPSMGFAETAGAAFKYGPESVKGFHIFAKEFVDITLAMTYYGSNCVYIVFVGNSIQQLAEYYYPDLSMTTEDFMWMLIIPFCLLCQIRELKYLVPFAVLANILLGTVFVISLYYMFRDMGDVNDRDLFSSFEQLPLFFSTVIFAMDGIGVVFPLENSMKNPHHFLGCPGVLNIAMSIVITLYASVGFFGYMAYGDDAQASITLNLPTDEIPAQIVKICIIIAVMLSFCLSFYVPLEITWRKVFESRIPEKFVNLTQVSLRIVVIVLSCVVAVFVGNLDYFIGLVGALSFSILGLIVPGILETVTYYNYGLGWITLIKDIGLITLGLVALTTGGYTNLMGIINSQS